MPLKPNHLARTALTHALAAVAIASVCPAVHAGELPAYRSSWLANTFSGSASHVLSRINAAAISPEGKVYCNVNWDEEHREGSIYQDGQYIGAIDSYGVKPNGDAIALNSTYAFAGSGTELQRYTRSDNHGYTKLQDLGESAVAIAATETQVAVTVRSGFVKLYQPSGTFIRQIAVSNPGAVAIASNGDIYVVTNIFRNNNTDNPYWDVVAGSSPTIVRYSNTGSLLSGSVAASSTWLPVSLSFDKNGLLYVADNGPDQNIKKYNVPAFSSAGTFGITGGYLAGPTPGLTGPQRLMRPLAVGTDSNLNLYVVGEAPNASGYKDRGRCVLRKFDTSGNLVWELLGLAFVDAGDPSKESDGLDVYSISNRMHMNYGNAIGQEWSHAACTVDPFHYPWDTRPGAARIVTLGGKKFMFSVGQFSTPIMIHKFVGEIAVPSVQFARQRTTLPGQPTASRKLFWRDSSGNGQPDSSDAWDLVDGDDGEFFGHWLDDGGNLWDAYWNGSKWRIREFNYGGLDSAGNPIYGWANKTEWDAPAEVTRPANIQYDAASDTMYLSGFNSANPGKNDQGQANPVPWGTSGTVLCRYDHWKGTRAVHGGFPITLNWFIKTYLDSNNVRQADLEHSTTPVGFSVAGNLASTTDNDGFIFIHQGPTGRETGRHGEVNVWRANSGAYVGYMQPINMAGSGEQVGWVDIRLPLKALRRSNGDYVLTMEEDLLQKFLLWKWNPTSGLYEAESLSVAAQSSATHRIITGPSFSNGAGTILDATVVGDYVGYTVPNVTAGSYDVRVGVKKFNSRGIVQLSVGRADNYAGTASNVGSPQDLYSSAEAYPELDLGVWSPGSTSDKQFRFTVTGKNAASSGYSLSIDYIKLVPQ